jgi:hypothetical protein
MTLKMQGRHAKFVGPRPYLVRDEGPQVQILPLRPLENMGPFRAQRLRLWSQRILKGFQPAGLIVERPQIIVHEGDEPNVVAHLLDADVASEYCTQVDFLPIEACKRGGAGTNQPGRGPTLWS